MEQHIGIAIVVTINTLQQIPNVAAQGVMRFTMK